MSAILSPASFAQLQGDLGYSYVFAAEAIRMEITEQLNVLGLGLIQLEGDLVGTGSDTVRVTRYGGVGFAETFQTMASETDAIVPTGFTTGYDTLSIARHGLAKEETYQGRILGRAGSLTLPMLIDKVPASWLATMRAKMCVAGASISGATGDAAAAWSFDYELDLITSYQETEGFGQTGDPEAPTVVTVRHPEQYTDLRDALRDEPAFQFPGVVEALMGLKPGGGSFDFLGMRNFASWDVTTAGGAHQGFSYVPGALGWVVASTTPIEVENPEQAIYVPEFGLIIERKSAGKVAQSRFDANAFFGTGRLDPTLFPQRRIISIND